jgi:hypothetical protein
VQEKECEQGPQPLTVQPNRAAVLDDRQRSENAELDGDLTFVAPVAICVQGAG